MYKREGEKKQNNWDYAFKQFSHIIVFMTTSALNKISHTVSTDKTILMMLFEH